jgi:hypothetical protein
LGASALTLLLVGAAAVWLVRPERGVSVIGNAGHETMSSQNAQAARRGIPIEQYPEPLSDQDMYQQWLQRVAAEAAVRWEVNSQADVEVLQAFAAVVNRGRVAAGLPPLADKVLVAPSAASKEALDRASGPLGGACGTGTEPAVCLNGPR